MPAAATLDGELRHFDSEGAFLETSVDEICVYGSRGISGVPGGMGLMNKIYGLVQVGRCLFNTICDKFEQSEADRRMFGKFDDGEINIVMLCTWATALLTLERRRRAHC